eukprot:gene8285-5976_t
MNVNIVSPEEQLARGSLSGSMSPISIAVRSTDFRRSHSRSDSMRKFVLSTRTGSGSIDLTDHDVKLHCPRPVHKSPRTSTSMKDAPLQISIPPFEEEQLQFYRLGNFFVQVESQDDDTDVVTWWPPVSPTDQDLKTPDQVLRDQYRHRFFQESGFDHCSETQMSSPSIKDDDNDVVLK